MSKEKQEQPEEKKGRISVGDLSQPERELTEREAENIKGGGGLSGDVVARGEVHIGEEIPQ
jgi:hypothetical protein